MTIDELDIDQKIRFLFAKTYSTIEKGHPIDANDVGVWDEYTTAFAKARSLLDSYGTNYLRLLSPDDRCAFLYRQRDTIVLFFEHFENSDQIGFHSSDGVTYGQPVRPYSPEQSSEALRGAQHLIDAYGYLLHYNSAYNCSARPVRSTP